MAPSKAPTSWDDADSDSTPPSSPPVAAARRKFDDEEDDSDVVESWDAAEDSEEEREKAKKASEAKAKADAAAKASHKSKSQRIEEKRQENLRKRLELEESSEEDEDEADKRARARESEKASDLKNAEDLFSGIGISDKRGAAKPVTIRDGEDPANALDLSSLKLFNPTTLPQFNQLRDTLVPLLNANSKKAQYPSFLQELTKQIVRDLNSEQIKKISSGLTTIMNEKMKEEKAADKSGKKSKAAKTKTSLSANRDIAHKADITSYEDGLAE
jgi:translation initiation factor 3 subunit J